MRQEELKLGNLTVKKVSIGAFEYFEGVKITRNCTGKMANLWALNTSMLINPLCKALSYNPKNICHECYAKAMLSYRRSCRDRFEKNFNLLTTKVLEYIPDLESEMVQKTPIFRFEEFGDIYNETQAINYLLIAIGNKSVNFGWWTKHLNLIDRALKISGLEVPENLSIVASSIRLNEVGNTYKNYGFVDHVFTVYSGKYAQEHNITTNCAASACYTCRRCYQKGGDFLISEMLKKEANKLKNK